MKRAVREDIMTPERVAMSNGWWTLDGEYWFHGDVVGYFTLEKPLYWQGTAKDLCLAHGYRFDSATVIPLTSKFAF